MRQRSSWGLVEGFGGRLVAGASLSAFCVSSAAQGQIEFTDHTAEAGVAVEHEPSVWFELSPLNVSMMTGGGAVGDFDRDGLQDLFVISGGTGDDWLFMNNGDGTFSDQAGARGLGVKHLGMGAAVGDFDGDGWLDLFVTSLGPATGIAVTGSNRLYHNLGDGTFENVAGAAGIAEIAEEMPDGFGSAFGDYDLDGDLDLFVAAWIPISNGNHLLRNNGDGTFTKVTGPAGLNFAGTRGFSPVFADMNGDRYPELLLAADFGTSRYFVNQTDGTFSDETDASGTGLDGNGMGHVVADVDGNGLPDWYVTSIHSLNSGIPNVPGTGNMLYLNTGDHVYDERSADLGVNDGGWGWGTVAFDADHDGSIDLVETNGWHQVNGEGETEWQDEQCYVWRNGGKPGFVDVTGQCGLVHTDLGRGMLQVDIENDADMDLVVFSYSGQLALFRNEHDAAERAGLRVFLDTSDHPGLAPDGYGAHVVATIDGAEHHRWLTGGAHYLSQSELSVHFGLGDAASVDTLEVIWPDGTSTVLTNVPGNQTLTIAPIEDVFGDLTGDGAVDVQDLVALLLVWGSDDANADLDGNGSVGVEDLVILIVNWS